MRRATSVAVHLFGNSLFRLGVAVAVAVQFAAAQQTGPSGASSAPSAPRFTSTFGPHSVAVPGQGGGFHGTSAPEYAYSWGIVSRTGHQNGHDRDGDRDRRRDHHRSGYGGYGYGYGGIPIYSTGLMPWDYGYLDNNGYAPEDNGPESAPHGAESAPPQYEEARRPPYAAPQTDYAPPPPRAALQATPAASAPAASSAAPTTLAGEPALTLVFRDGHRQSVRNYALTGTSLIVLDDAASGRQQRIPLADLDLAATKQAAAEAGLDFNPPA